MSTPLTNLVTVEIVSSENWQKSETTVHAGSNKIFKTILAALNGGRGALIGRNGSIELSMMVQILNGESIDPVNAAILEKNAGIFPHSEKSVYKWFGEYTAAVINADCMAVGWYKPFARSEWRILEEKNPYCIKIPLRSLEPYYCNPIDQWSRILEGRRVTVVSSFTKSMELQLPYKEQIWPHLHDTLLPSADWSFVRSYYAPVLARGRAQWPDTILSWNSAVDTLEKEVLATNPEIVLIGCGGIGMILGHRLKAKKIIAIVMGGAIQVLFGIKGRRWENHQISSFWNSDWIRPEIDEMPLGSNEIEGGCYW